MKTRRWNAKAERFLSVPSSQREFIDAYRYFERLFSNVYRHLTASVASFSSSLSPFFFNAEEIRRKSFSFSPTLARYAYSCVWVAQRASRDTRIQEQTRAIAGVECDAVRLSRFAGGHPFALFNLKGFRGMACTQL